MGHFKGSSIGKSAVTLAILLSTLAAVDALADIPLTHSSANSPGSTKWGGAWGVTGGKYGAFECKTCHENQRVNIKLVKPAIPTYIGISTATPKSVQFKNVTSFGNDNETRLSSARICEVCHTQTAVHRYDTTGQTETNHQNANNTDCTTCHSHKRAFIATTDHTINLDSATNPYTGPNTCLGCHETSRTGSSTSADLYNSVHFQLRTLNSDMDIPGGGSHGMLDRACGLPGTTAMAGNWAGTAISPINGAPYDDGCGKCHVTYKMPYRYPTAADARPDFDCLICHAKVYGKEWEDPAIQALYGTNPENHDRKVITLTDGSKSWSQDRSTKTAQTAGKVQVKSCLRCHEHGLDGYKRSTPYTAENDVHAERNMLCTECHTTAQHKMARGNYVTDGMANEMPGTPVTCTGACHTNAPHNAANASDLNKHSTNVSCEACHIPTLNNEHGNDIHKRAWAPFTLNPMTGTWDATPVMTNAEYPGYYDAYTTYFAPGTTPTIRWFNGKASMLAQPYGGYSSRADKGGASKLFAFREFVNGMLFDAGWLAQSATYQNPNLDHVNQTAPYSMKYFFNANWDKFKMFGFADAAAYPTALAYWTARPDMAYQMNNFPMMLQFNRAIFLSEAGQKIGNPPPGPQSAATYPGVAKAINSGMGSMAIDMGYAPPGTDPIVAGQAMWSGQFFGMWVPPNMDPKSPFMGEINSFITMSHGIKGATALNTIATQKYNGNICSSCHYTGAEYAAGILLNKRLDFAKLGYPSQGTITDPFYSPSGCASCHPLATLLTSGAHGKHISSAPRFYNMTGNHSTAGGYDFGCANCHPLDLANHQNNTLNVTLNKTNSGNGGNVGRLRALNSATTDGLAAVNGPSGVFGTTRVSVKCSASYCHSNGYATNLQFTVSPDWYGPAYTGDKCAMCHGNTPNSGGKVGSATHSKHEVGIHYKNIFNGKSGLLPEASTTKQNVGHGYGWSSTISCNTCHSDTVTTGFNAANLTCATASCHGTGGVYTTNFATIANKAVHVNGVTNLKFVNSTFKSKAQLRVGNFDSYTAAGQGGWSRNGGYKNYTTSFDVTKQTLRAGTIWSQDAMTTTCTTACHANKLVLWNATTTCVSCHTRL